MLQFNHLEAAAIFALFTSIVFAIITKDTMRDRVVYFAWCFAAFIGAVVGLGWLMKLAHG